jgi:diguanylate cyclase (GGDEF)-like protein
MIKKEEKIKALQARIKILESELKQARRAHLAVDAAGFDIWENNFATGESTGTNYNLFKQLGYDDEEMPQSVEELIKLVHPEDLVYANELMKRHFEGLTERYSAELRIKAKDGSWVWTGNYGQVKDRNQTGEITQFIGLNFNIDKRHILEDAMKKMAFTDDLTSLGNRRYLFDQGEIEINKCKRYKRDLSVIFADIDYFKAINDAYGHAVGDEILKLYADTIKNAFRNVDLKYRYGGDEFIIIMPETDMNAAYESAVRFIHTIANLKPKPLQSLTTSIGLACYHDENTLEELIKKADYALYQAKEKGRNCVMVYQND